MKKNIVVFSLLFAISTNFSASALTINEDGITKNIRKYTISGTAEQGEVVGYSVVYGNTDRSEAENLYALGETIADEQGKYEIIFELDEEAPDGEYNVYASNYNQDFAQISFKFSNYKDVENKILNVTSAEQLGVELLSDENKEKLNEMGFELDMYSSLSPKSQSFVNVGVYTLLPQMNSSFENVLECYKIHLGVAMMNDNIFGGIEMINPSFENEKYNDITDNNKKSFLKSRVEAKAPYISVENFNDEYTLQNIFYTLKTATVGEFEIIVDRYKGSLKFENTETYATFNSLSKTKKENIAGAYLRSKESGTVSTTAGFDELMSKLMKSNDSNSGGGHSSSKDTSSKYTGSGSGFIVPAQYQFNDLANYQWAESEINALYNKGIVSGVGNGRFAPEANVTREQMVKMIMVAIGKVEGTTKTFFDDVDNTSWYAQYVNKAAELGIVSGISENEFGVSDFITRQDLAVIAVRAARTIGLSDYDYAETAPFDDFDDISDYAKESVNILFKNKIVVGTENKFMPKNYCTRAEAAKIIYNIFIK